MNDLLIQAIGFIAVVFFIVSYQVRSNRHLFLYQLVGCLIFTAQLLILGAYTGAFSAAEKHLGTASGNPVSPVLSGSAENMGRIRSSASAVNGFRCIREPLQRIKRCENFCASAAVHPRMKMCKMIVVVARAAC